MKGRLNTNEEGFIVRYANDTQFLPLHPSDKPQALDIYSDLSNIYLEVDFDIVELDCDGVIKAFAKIIYKEPTLKDKLISFLKNEKKEIRDFVILFKDESDAGKLDLDKLDKKLDNALEKETDESLTNWLNSKRGNNFENLINDYVEELIQANSVREHEKAWISNICYHLVSEVKKHLYTDDKIKQAIEMARQEEEPCWSWKFTDEQILKSLKND